MPSPLGASDLKCSSSKLVVLPSLLVAHGDDGEDDGDDDRNCDDA